MRSQSRTPWRDLGMSKEAWRRANKANRNWMKRNGYKRKNGHIIRVRRKELS